MSELIFLLDNPNRSDERNQVCRMSVIFVTKEIKMRKICVVRALNSLLHMFNPDGFENRI